MNLPKYLKIGGNKTKVEFPYVFRERSDLMGQSQYNPRTIRIADRDSCGQKFEDQDIVETFIHEVLHQICSVYNGGEHPEEKTIHAISQGIFQVLRDNDFSEVFEVFRKKDERK